MSRLAQSVALSVALISLPSAYAQVNTYMDDFLQFNDTLCFKQVPEMVGMPELAAAIAVRPIDVKAVCACTRQSLLDDPRLREKLNGERQVVAERMNSSLLMSYATLRILQSSIACLAPELDRTLRAVELPQ